MQNNEWIDIAKEVLLKIGAIETCDAHEEYYYDTYKYDNNNILGIALEKFNELYKDAEIHDCKDFCDAVNTVFQEAGDDLSECPYCFKAYND